MGNTNSQSDLPHLQQHGYLNQWETIDHLTNYNLVKNIRTGQLGESRKYKLDARYDPREQLKIYQLRALSQEPIVKVYSAEILDKVSKKIERSSSKSNINLCSSHIYLGVVTQKIQYLLSQISKVSFPEALYILKQSLKGFEYLYPRTGPVRITNKMIAINKNNNVKVWVNEDFCQNHPNKQISTLLSTRNQALDRGYNMITPQHRDQKQMIQNIIDAVQQKIQPRDRQSFSDFFTLFRQNSYSFKNVQRFISQYIINRHIRVPSQMQPRNIQRESFDIQQVVKRIQHKSAQNAVLPNNQAHFNPKIPLSYPNQPVINYHINPPPFEQNLFIHHPVSIPPILNSNNIYVNNALTGNRQYFSQDFTQFPSNCGINNMPFFSSRF